jgi:ligand-binding sensor domain-containing protein
MRKYCLHIILFLFAVHISAQTYDFRNFNVDDGLSQSQVFCIFQDSKGYMWFGTNGGGASKFDGKKFQSFTPANGALSNYVYCINEDKSQNIYLATNDGVQITGKYKNIRLDSTKGMPASESFFVFIDKSDKVWIGTKRGVCFLDENKKPVKLTGDEKIETSSVWTIFQDGKGDYWFGTMQYGACRYSPETKKFTWYSMTDGLGSDYIRSFNEDNKGHVWFGTLAGLSKLNTATNKVEKINLPGIFLENLAFTSISKIKIKTCGFLLTKEL